MILGFLYSIGEFTNFNPWWTQSNICKLGGNYWAQYDILQVINLIIEGPSLRPSLNTLIINSYIPISALFIRLRTSGAIVRIVGDLLLDNIPHLAPHIRWCSCQLNACTLLQSKSTDPQFKDFEINCSKDSRTGGLPLSSFLLKPMQRVTKYPLLIKKVILIIIIIIIVIDCPCNNNTHNVYMCRLTATLQSFPIPMCIAKIICSSSI